MDSEKGLAVSQGGVGQGVNRFHGAVGHGEAADGDAAAVNHECAAGTAMDPVVGVGVAQVEGQMKAAERVHPVRRDEVKAFGRSSISLPEFRPLSLPTIGAD